VKGTRIAVVVAFAVAAIAVAGCGGDEEAAPPETTGTETTVTETTDTTTSGATTVLRGTVGPGFTISLTTEDGQPVETLPAGGYTLFTDDKSDIHNFHLTGEGVDVTTDVSGSGTDSFDLDLTSGTYTFVCDPHAGSMNGSFEVSG